jgi:hypothetical protein
MPLTNCCVSRFLLMASVVSGPYSVLVFQQFNVTSLIIPKYMIPSLSMASAAD